MTTGGLGDDLTDHGLSYRLGLTTLRPLARALWRPHVDGRENVPATGAVLFASNHLAFVDSVAIPFTAPRRVRFLAKSSYFEGEGLRGAIRRRFFTAVGAIGVERGAGSAAQDALDIGRAILERGDAFVIYPEGTRSLDGRLYRGRTGVAWLALTTGAPVIPVGLIGTQNVQPAGASRPHLASVTVRFGEPIDVSRHGAGTSGRARRHATDEIMAAIAELSGQERADTYNEPPATTVVERVKRRFRANGRL